MGEETLGDGGFGFVMARDVASIESHVVRAAVERVEYPVILVDLAQHELGDRRYYRCT